MNSNEGTLCTVWLNDDPNRVRIQSLEWGEAKGPCKHSCFSRLLSSNFLSKPSLFVQSALEVRAIFDVHPYGCIDDSLMTHLALKAVIAYESYINRNDAVTNSGSLSSCLRWVTVVRSPLDNHL